MPTVYLLIRKNRVLKQLHHSLVTKGPSFLRVPAQWVPFSVKQTVLLNALSKVFHEALEDGDFEFLEDRWLEVSVIDLGLTAYVSYANDALVVAQTCEQVDVCFSGTANDLILIAARKEDPDTLFFQRRLAISGDTELGLEVKNLMDSVDWAALPKPMTVMLEQLAQFIEAGMTYTAEPEHAYKN
uniref:ubiquinone anaerobic biosynthesis accessory factor UbiT n=1 Tax=Thaumasiovibrio occultus TaxID=1891184 RepID=UPI000B34D56B|nr:SCP2 domain-containing protein [Thaumasiovibrio occultus]